MTDTTTDFIIFQISRDLFDAWDWFEHRGYLPPMPGTLQEEMTFNHREGRWEAHLIVTAAEIEEFSHEAYEMGGDFGSCVRSSDLRDIVNQLLR